MSDSDMMADPERDAALLGALAHVAQLGWTMEAVRAALAEQGATPDDATLLFPGGAAELVSCFNSAWSGWRGGRTREFAGGARGGGGRVFRKPI